MSKTCADCHFHECKNSCIKSKYSCDGYCSNKKSHRQCDMSRCPYFIIDSFFTLDSKFKFKEIA